MEQRHVNGSCSPRKSGSVNNGPIARHCKRDIWPYAGQGGKSKKAVFRTIEEREQRMLFRDRGLENFI